VPPTSLLPPPLDHTQVRAFGLLLADVAARTEAGGAGEAEAMGAARRLIDACVCCTPAARPTFAEAARTLLALQCSL